MFITIITTLVLSCTWCACTTTFGGFLQKTVASIRRRCARYRPPCARRLQDSTPPHLNPPSVVILCVPKTCHFRCFVLTIRRVSITFSLRVLGRLFLQNVDRARQGIRNAVFLSHVQGTDSTCW